MPARARASRVGEPGAPYLARALVMVDSNIWIDIFERDPKWFEWSAKQLAPLIDERRAVINPVIYAEIATNFTSIETLNAVLAEYGPAREPLPWHAAFAAAQAFKMYRKRGGAKRSPLPDFYIGAHASLEGHTLLTRDPARYREYFPRLRMVTPS